MSVLIPDVSEYQTVDFGTFTGPIIVRAHNGWRADNHWTRHADGASNQAWWGAYQYLPATVDPAAAAQAFLTTLAGYRPNVTILDLEEGDGDQSARQHAWLSVMAGDPATDWTYSGAYFARTHGLTVEWIAAYGQREPTDTHLLWQYADNQYFAGIGNCDGSVFNGDLGQLIALTNPPAAPVSEDEDMLNLIYNGGQYLLHAGKIVPCSKPLPAAVTQWPVDDRQWHFLTDAFGQPAA